MSTNTVLDIAEAMFIFTKLIRTDMLLSATGIETRMPTLIAVESNCSLSVL